MNPKAAPWVLVSITTIWGLTFVTVKGALDDADPATFLALRFSLAALVGAFWVGRRLRSPQLWRDGAVLAVFLLLGYQLQTFGLAYTTPARSAFVTGLTVVTVAPFEWWLTGRAPGWKAGVGAALSVLGLYLLTGADFKTGLQKGELLTLGCAIAYGMHIALTGRYAQRHEAFSLVTTQLIFTALGCVVFAAFGPRTVTFTLPFIGAVLACGVLATTVAIGLQIRAQALVPASRAALFYALEPVVAALSSAALGRERLGWFELFGGALIVGGVLVGSLATPAEAPA